MKRLALALAAVAVLAASSQAGAQSGAQAGAQGRGRMRPGANPSALVAAEIAFARLAREKGQWTAFREYADDDGVMFVPQAVRAKDWLKGRKDPPAPVQWQAHQVWMSCDGSLGVTKGAWQRPDGSTGYFTTIWKRRDKGDYRWVLDQGDALAQPLEAPEMLSAAVADCAPRGEGPRRDGPPPAQGKQAHPVIGPEGAGASDDGSLAWSYKVAPDGGRALAVTMRKGGAMREVLSLTAAPQER